MESALKYKENKAKTVNFLPNIRLAQSILKRKFPSVDKRLQKKATQKGPLENISPGAYFGNFTVYTMCRTRYVKLGHDDNEH